MPSRIKAIIAILSLSTHLAYAECPKPVQSLQKGDLAPCKGFLFSPEKEQEVRQLDMDYKVLLEQSKLYIQKEKLLEEQLKFTEEIVDKEAKKSELWRSKAYEMTEKYMEAEDNRGKRDLLFLIGGVVLTVAAGWSIGQASK